MIDATKFGLELAGMVKAQLAPVLERLEAMEKRLDALPAPIDLSDELAEVRAAVEAIEIPTIPPAPELPDIAGMVDEAVKCAVSSLPPPESGVGVAGAIIDRTGELVVTTSDGKTHPLGRVVGKDGEPGRNGFNLEDFDASLMDDGRTVLLSFGRGEASFKVELGFPVMLYRGVFKDGETYERGDTVTWAGSLWHCDEATGDKPGDGAKNWTLCAKKGRDGKDGQMKQATEIKPLTVVTGEKGN